MCTQALAAHGARVYITGRREEVLNQAVDNYHKHAKGEIIGANVTEKSDLEKIIKDISEKEPNGIQILVNNAGISGPKTEVFSNGHSIEEASQKFLKNESFDQWDSVWRTNVSGVFFTTVAFLPLLAKGGDNNMNYRSGVVNITSISGMVKISQNHFAYNASKAAAIHLTKMMACELANSKIRFNSIAPGVFPSEMTAKCGSDDRGKSDISESFDASKYKIPAGRPGRLEEMAASILYVSIPSPDISHT
ncbi:hypothetical protein PGT21_000393 [Puccinia graminis f. sp. tritici]|uniref:NAD(P)-binding protein n=1 Tax=Puccinia graminis f. sp. tritici TaxID=56615 RepID=A0A5B0PPB1_PUCGR|nr:hypothetical protein PGT21_000393 [Puccinia graminis f. sp. tritici]